MSQKRQGTFNHYESNRSKQPKTYNSRHPDTASHSRPAQRVYNSQNPDTGSHARSGPDNNARNIRHQLGPQKENRIKVKDNPVLQHIERLPDPGRCEHCKLAAAECETGMVALLSKIEAEEATFKGDKDILHHARELRKLLSVRAGDQSHASALQQIELDQKWPRRNGNVNVPAYVLQQLKKAKDLPPLPPITEPYLSEAVFTHASVHTRRQVKGSDNSDDLTYERLEFLGDAYIELIASRLIYTRLPHIDVPQQAHFREQLVKNETLGQFSVAYGLPDRLKHGAHMKESKAWNKVVADVFEAYVAGIILSDPEDGFETAESWLTKLWAPQMLDFQPKIIENPKAKEELARLIEGKDVSLNYREEQNMVYENGVQKYFVGVYLTGWGYENEWLGSGEGRSKAQAAVYAAMDALKRDSIIVRTAAKRKQEVVEQRQAKKEAMTREVEKIKVDELEEGATTETNSKDDLSMDRSAKGHEEKSSSKKIPVADPTLWLEEANKKDKDSSVKDHTSWLEKEMKKKEKKERHEKKERSARR